MRHLTASLGVMLALASTPTLVSAQLLSTTTVSPAEMQATAVQALRVGQSARALALSEALLIRDENDPLALRIAGQAALAIGRSDVAVRYGTRLYRNSDDPIVRFDAARLVALGHAQQDNLTQAQLWLRRARQAAPTDQDAAAIANDYNILRQRNPWSFYADFGISPSSNINNGSSGSTFDIDLLGSVLTLPLPQSAQELSGYEISASARGTYRLSDGARHRTLATFGVQSTSHVLSSESRDAAPDFDVSNLNYWQLNSGIDHAWAVGDDNLPASVSLDYAITFVDGDLFASNLQLGMGRRWRAGEDAIVTGTVNLGHTDYRAADVTSTLWATSLDWQYSLPNSDIVEVSGNVGASISDASRYDYTFQGIGVRYDFGRVAERFDISLSAQYDWRTYGSRSAGTVTREDETANLSLSVGVPDLELYGFHPILTGVMEHTSSTSQRFSTEELSVDLSFRSSF